MTNSDDQQIDDMMRIQTAVEGLGEFLELEVVLRDGEFTEEGVVEAHRIMAQLGVGPQQLLEDAYVDQLRQPGTSV